MKTHDILKQYCKYIFIVGVGNFWCDADLIDDTRITYRLFQFILFSLYIFMTGLEILAAVIGDFPKDEKSDAVTFAVCHTIVMIKIVSVVINKNAIKKLNKDMDTICQEFEAESLNDEKYKSIKLNILAYFLGVYGTMVCFVAEGYRKMREGKHFVTVVTYYPSYNDNSLLATGFRITMTIMLVIMLMTMIVSVDGATMMYLILFKYKIIALRNHLENIRKEFDRLSKIDLNQASTNLANGLIKGIATHAKLISMCKDIDTAFGTVMTLQVCQSSASAVSLLLQIALSKDITFVATLKIAIFIVTLFFLLALFLCNAGEITYQASLLSDAIFFCGWHACKPQPCSLGRIVEFSIAQAQRPLVMKSFKMLDLTYSTFLQVVRSTYSVFALFYAQNK